MLGKHCSADSEHGKLRQLGGIVPPPGHHEGLSLCVVMKVAFEMHFGNFNTSIILTGVVSPGKQ